MSDLIGSAKMGSVMKIIITKSDWGMDHMGSTADRMEAVAAAGFDGFEQIFNQPNSILADVKRHC